MADFEARRSPFDWDEELRRARLNKLLDLIQKYELTLFSCSVPLEPFEAVSSSRAMRFWGGPYGLAAQMFFVTVANATRDYLEKRGATVAYFFEQGIKGWGQINRAFDSSRRERKMGLQTLTLVQKKGIPPVQAADIVVYEWNKELSRILELPNAPPKQRYPMKRLEQNEHEWKYIPEETLETFSAAVDTAMGKAVQDALKSGRRRGKAEINYSDVSARNVELPPELEAIMNLFKFR